MKALFSKKIVASAIAALSLLAGASANAAVFNPFIVKPTGPAVPAPFEADRITGGYAEIATFTPTSPDGNSGTFQISLRWVAGQFINNSDTPDPDELDAGDTGLGFDYGLYALYTASGTFTRGPGGTATFNFAPSNTQSLKVYLDDDRNTTFTAPGTGATEYARANFGDDILLATGSPLAGQGTLNPALNTCGGGGGQGINCGSFGSTTSFNLTTEGSNFFIDPAPFYNLSFQSGQLNNFQPVGTVSINGSLDVVFGVPEPTSLGLLGLGFLGLGAAAKRRKQAK